MISQLSHHHRFYYKKTLRREIDFKYSKVLYNTVINIAEDFRVSIFRGKTSYSYRAVISLFRPPHGFEEATICGPHRNISCVSFPVDITACSHVVAIKDTHPTRCSGLPHFFIHFS